MALPRLPFRPSPLAAWAVEPSAAQLTWGDLPVGSVSITAHHGRRPAASITIEHPGGPGVVDIDGLLPDAEHRLVVTAASGSAELTVATPAPPPGAELYRFATISDLHLGSDHFGFFKLMKERPAHPEPFAVRSARSAVAAAVAWGAEHLIIKGDAAHHGCDADFDEVGRLIDHFPDLPVTLLPGNHDVDERETTLPDCVGRRRTPYERGVSHLDRPGIRLVVGDTTIPRAGIGTLRRIEEQLLDAAATSDRGVMLLIHQQLQRTDPVRYWPPGIPHHEANRFLDRLAAVRSDAVVTSGHTHRNRARQHGTVLITEVASTHHWPGVWAGYAVHEGGIRQVVRRIGGADIIGWHEYSKNATLSVWQRYSEGRLEQRCLTHRWR